jgi:hypothetical protein
LRLAAQLALGQPGGFVLLAGRYAGLHEALLDVVDTTCVLVDSPRPPASAAVSIRVQETLPIVDGAMRGAAVDTHKAPGFLAEVTRCLGAGSRLVAPSSMALPPAVQLLARDEREWVAEVPGVLPTVPLGRSTRLSRP